MNLHLIKWVSALFAGVAATAGLVRLVSWAPVPSYVKWVLAVVIPVPAAAIGLVMVYYGPAAAAEPQGLGMTANWPGVFLTGCLAALGWKALGALWRLFQTRRGEDPEDA